MPDDPSTPVHPEPITQPPDLIGMPLAGPPVDTPPAPPLDPPPEEPPAAWVLPPRKPGPGLLATVGWMFLFLVLQVSAVLSWVGLTRVGVLNRDVSALIVPLIVLNFILEIGLVAAALRGQFLRVLAVRSIHPFHVLLVLALVLPMTTVSVSMALWLSGLNHQPSGPEVPEIYKGLTQLPVPALLVIACLLPGLGEEIFFRGFIARGLVARYGLVIGAAVSSILFGLMHPDSAAHIASTTLLGVAVYLVFLFTKTIWAPFLLHALNNGIAFGAEKLLAYFGAEMNDASPGIPVKLVVTAAAAVVTLMVVLYQTRTHWILPNGRLWAPGYLTTEMPPRIVAARPTIGVPRLWAVVAALAACGGFGWALVVSL